MSKLFCLSWVITALVLSPALAEPKKNKKKRQKTSVGKEEKYAEIDRLLELNSGQIFGGVATVKDG